MIIKIINQTGFAQISNTTLRDNRLSLDTLGLLCRLLSLPEGHDLSVENILDMVNDGNANKIVIGEKSLRRMCKELKNFGYLEIKSIYNKEERKFRGKEWIVYGVSQTLTENSDSGKTPLRAGLPSREAPLEAGTIEINLDKEEINSLSLGNKETHTTSERSEPKKETAGAAVTTASSIFQEIFDVDLDLTTIKLVNASIPAAELEFWRTVCVNRFCRFDEGQKRDRRYRFGALEFLLEDFPKKLKKRNEEEQKQAIATSRSTAERQEKSNFSRPAPVANVSDGGGVECKGRSFAEIVDDHFANDGWGDEEYNRFRYSIIAIATAKGNKAKLEEVEAYEGLRRTEQFVAERKAAKRILSQ
jgi:hypothetical protein